LKLLNYFITYKIKMGPKKKKGGKKKGGGDSGGPDLKNKMEIMSKEMAIKNI